jgi:hypothetical protein
VHIVNTFRVIRHTYRYANGILETYTRFRRKCHDIYEVKKYRIIFVREYFVGKRNN